MKRLRILLADNHPVVLEGLRRILDRPEFEIVGTVPDGRALVQTVTEIKPDVILVDVTMPLLNGIEAVRQIRKHDKDVKIVFLTMHPEVTYAREALASGGSAYVLKSSASEELVTAIEAALKGRTDVSASIAEPVMQALQSGSHRTVAGRLTPRQREVLQLLAEGRQVKEIAELLHISPRTAEFHKYSIMEAIGAHTVAELLRYASRHGIVT
jgi:DNA-binding NarL/FixJ family response regulator